MCVRFNPTPIITATQLRVDPPVNTATNFDLASVTYTRPKVYNQPPTPPELANQEQPSRATVSTNTEEGITPTTVSFNMNREPENTNESSLTSPNLAQRLDPTFLTDFNTYTQDGVLDTGELSNLDRRANSIQNNDTRSASKSFLAEVVRNNNNGQPIPINVGDGQRNITIRNSTEASPPLNGNSYAYGSSTNGTKPVSLDFSTNLNNLINKGIDSVTDQDLAILNNSRRINNQNPTVSPLGNSISGSTNQQIDSNETEAYEAFLNIIREDSRPEAKPAENIASSGNTTTGATPTSGSPETKPTRRSNFALLGTYESTTIVANAGNRLSFGVTDAPTAGLRRDSSSRLVAAEYERSLGDGANLSIVGGVVTNSTSITTGNINTSEVNTDVAFGRVSYTNGDTSAALSFNQRIGGNNDRFVGDVTFSLSRDRNTLNLGLENRDGRQYGVVSADYRLYEGNDGDFSLRAGGTTEGNLFVGMNGKLRF